jgi:hypothetical protein
MNHQGEEHLGSYSFESSPSTTTRNAAIYLGCIISGEFDIAHYFKRCEWVSLIQRLMRIVSRDRFEGGELSY